MLGEEKFVTGTAVGTEKKCEPTYHRYYSLDPVGVEETRTVLVISVCSNCGDVKEHRTKV